MPITIKDYEDMDDFLSIVAILNSRLTGSIDDATKPLNEHIIVLEYRIKDLEDQLAASKEETKAIGSLQDSLTIKENAVEALKEEVKKWTFVANARADEIRKLDECLIAWKASSNNRDKEIETLKASCVRLDKERISWKESHSNRHVEIDDLKQKLVKIQEENELLKYRIEVLQNTLALANSGQSCDEAIVVRDSHIENLQKEIESLKQEIEKLKDLLV